MVFVFFDLPKVWVVIPRAVPTSVVSEGVVLSVPGGEIFSFSLISRFHCAVESAVLLSGCNIVGVYFGDLVYCGVYESLLLFLLFLMTSDCLDSWSILTAWSIASCRVLIQESTFTILYESLSAVYSGS